MARINIPFDALTSRLNLSGRFDGVGAGSLTSRFANLKPITEFLDIKRMSKPRDFGEVQSRVNYNLSYFSSNYAVVFVMLSIYSLLNNLTLTFVILFIVGGMYGIGKLEGRDLDVGFARATSAQLYTALFVVAIPILLWSSPFSTFLWLIGATGVSILGHAALLEKDVSAEFEVSDGSGVIKSGDKEFRKLARPKGERFEELYSDEEVNENGYRVGDLYYMDTRAGYRNAYYDDSEGDDNEQDGTLIRAALDRLAKAKTKGKINVSIPLEELEALERRHGQQVVSPPTTPKAQTKSGSRSGVLSNLVNTRPRKKSSSPATPKTTPRSNSKAKISRKNSDDAVPINDSPNVLIQGPDGMPMYAQLAQLPTGYAHMPRTRSRSVSQSHRRDTTPPDQIFNTPGRFYAQLSSLRSASDAARPFMDESEVLPRMSPAQYRVSDAVPQMQGRRHLSGPPEIVFSTLRRVPPASSPLVPRPGAPQHSNSDPNMKARRFGSSSSDDQPMQVEVVPDGDGYAVSRTPVKEAESRRRRSRK